MIVPDWLGRGRPAKNRRITADDFQKMYDEENEHIQRDIGYLRSQFGTNPPSPIDNTVVDKQETNRKQTGNNR